MAVVDGDSDGEESMAVEMWWQMASIASFTANSFRGRGGSAPGKAGNTWRDYGGAHLRYMTRHFWPSDQPRPGTSACGPSQPEREFERRFRMPRSVFDKIFEGVTQTSEYFLQGLKPDACGKIGITPLIEVLMAMRMISYGIPADFCDDLFDVSETTACLCLEEFFKAMVTRFGSLYLRLPNAEDVMRIERQFRELRFPGCIGAVDCAGWFWKQCPKALQGIMVGKDAKPVLRLECICDVDLWCWHLQFGFPGSMNDVNILNASDHFSSVLSGAFPSSLPSFKIGEKSFN